MIYVRVLRKAIDLNIAEKEDLTPPIAFKEGRDGEVTRCWRLDMPNPSSLVWNEAGSRAGPWGKDVHCWLETTGPVFARGLNE